MAVALRALDASVEVQGRERRSIPIAEFHRVPGDTPQIENTLKPGELITAVTLPRPPTGKQIYRKVRDRASYAFALVSVAAIVTRDSVGRFAVGGIAPKPWRSEAADSALENGAKSAAAELLKDAAPTDDNRFKVALVERTLQSVLNSARG
jgi:xanthine dehydrogenase YagS FAD-binding subunit